MAVATIIRQGDRVLLVQRVNDPYRGMWTLPAGFVDAGEDPAEAARRECLEETGFQVNITRLVDVIARQEHPRGADILIVYEGQIASGHLSAGDDAGDAGFFPLQDLPPLAFISTSLILKSIQV